MKKLKNRVAVITGGSRGIGKAVTTKFAQEGANIVFSYHKNKEAADRTKAEIEALGVECLAVQADAGNETDVKRMVKEVQDTFGHINILFNNAGTIGLEVTVAEMESEEWDRVINTDLRGIFLNSKYFIPLIATGKGNPVGKIINTSSELSKKRRAKYAHYAAAKGTVNSFTMCLALELAPDTLVNTLAPGPIETDMILADMEPEWIEKEKDIPLKRLGTAEEMAATALLLASDDGNFFCGQFVSPNGGAVFF